MAMWEAEALSHVYGIDADTLSASPIVLDPGDVVQVLPLVDEFQEVEGEVKLRILSAARAARDLYSLRAMLEEGDPWAGHRGIPPLKSPRRGASPHEAGRYYAAQIRAAFGLGRSPIASVRDFLEEAFPHIAVLYAHLGSVSLSGVALGDAVRGPTILLNLEGKNQNPGVRRFSLLHELFHLLVDMHDREPLVTLSGFLQDAGLDRERRANAFAARLLCPEDVVQDLAKRTPANPLAVAERLIDEYGMHYGAARLYLRNVVRMELPDPSPDRLVASATSPRWQQAEEPVGIATFPLSGVPTERRTAIARRAATLYSVGKISRDRFAELLGLAPTEEVERVLGFLGLDLPDDA